MLCCGQLHSTILSVSLSLKKKQTNKNKNRKKKSHTNKAWKTTLRSGQCDYPSINQRNTPLASYLNNFFFFCFFCFVFVLFFVSYFLVLLFAVNVKFHRGLKQPYLHRCALSDFVKPYVDNV